MTDQVPMYPRISMFSEGPSSNKNHVMTCLATSDSDKGSDNGSAPRIIRSHGGDFVRQPCKARGVIVKPGQDPHIARYAYVDIPLGSIHGTVLSCCHPACIASGRRFCYCTHCRTAVAKRNFNIRHAHGNLNSPPLPPVRPNTVMGCEFGDGQIQHDGAETSIPTVISISDLKDSKSWAGDGASTMVSLSRQEFEIIKLLRSRPAGDYPELVNRWKETLFQIADFGYINEPDEGPCDAVETGSGDACTSTIEHRNEPFNDSSSPYEAERDNSATSTDHNENDSASFSVDEFGIDDDVVGFFEDQC